MPMYLGPGDMLPRKRFKMQRLLHKDIHQCTEKENGAKLKSITLPYLKARLQTSTSDLL